jgi:hypothetical protein
MPSIVNEAFMRLSKRAEVNDRSKLLATFVDIGPLFTLLSGSDHQVIYGRRGTGKTHALSFLAETKTREGDLVVYVDLRTVGSTGGIYSDNTIPTHQRATRLLTDTLAEIHDRVLAHFIQNSEKLNLSVAGPKLDLLADEITRVRVVGDFEKQEASTNGNSDASSGRMTFDLLKPGAQFEISGSRSATHQQQSNTKESGTVQNYVHFGALNKRLSDVMELLDGKKIWVLLDEWSSIPIDLQPYLADLLRRSVFPVRNFSVKIGAIEQRSKFQISIGANDYLGIELGADAFADVNLDDYMVFDNDSEKSKEFFSKLLFRHLSELDDVNTDKLPKSPELLIQEGFTQINVFEEFVRAAEGVPRDAINIINLASQKAIDDKIGMVHIRTAARNWYQRDKESAVRASNRAHELLHWIVENVIGKRKARAFLLKNDRTPELIEQLFDSRVLHILKHSVSSQDNPGSRYDVYKLDYGCYVDLISTVKAPLGLLQIETDSGETYIDVPLDDYRAIRRAILDIDEFYTSDQSGKINSQISLFGETDK